MYFHLHLESCTEVPHFNRMGHIIVQDNSLGTRFKTGPIFLQQEADWHCLQINCSVFGLLAARCMIKMAWPGFSQLQLLGRPTLKCKAGTNLQLNQCMIKLELIVTLMLEQYYYNRYLSQRDFACYFVVLLEFIIHTHFPMILLV